MRRTYAHALGIRVVVDLVVNHTSIDHPWFQHARKNRDSPFRDWYVWSKTRPANHDTGRVFPGVQIAKIIRRWCWRRQVAAIDRFA